ncbi:UTRA domain-containing protein [Bradyrhizobium sp. Arg237L]|uniref:UTRA domain-containing protein n=1 Tax=Bradyrhizobium sp. Arg237L TaxID=3003352 RepID=UPI00249E8B3B|nr:UTRA domain-containing protein [Bradyrhizobium sp. Arg237L]MDI4238583.1 UTRA domain-containing protein [Bradyrhizobium sp. Arg237L]
MADRPPSELIQLESSWRHLLRTLDGNVAELIEVRDDVALPNSALQAGMSKGRYRYMRRIHRRRSAAYCIMEMYLDSELYERDPERFDEEMVIPLLSRLVGPTLKHMNQTFRIGSASMETAKILGIPPGAPTGEVTRVIINVDNEVLYLGSASYRGDMVVFNTSIEVPRT